MNEHQKKFVFISHASADARKAAALCKAIEDLGFACWIAPRDIDPGKQYGEEIIHGIESTDGLVLMLSGASNASPHVRDEAERAKHYGKRVIPFRIEDVTPSKSLEFYIATSQWIDAHGNRWNEGVDQLAAAIARMAGQTPPLGTTARTVKARAPRLALACLAIALAGLGAWALKHHGSQNPRKDPGAAESATIALDPGETRGVRLPIPKDDIHPNISELVPKYHALVIGINNYADYGAEGWDDLNTASRDAEQVASTLNQNYGFDVTQLLDGAATRANIMQALDTIATSNPNDAILIYYAGHGYYNSDLDQGYWIPSDARRKTDDGREAKQDWIWNSTLQEMLNSTKSRHVLVIADSCFSGSLFRGSADETASAREDQWYRRAIKKDSRYLITSGDLEPVMDGGGGGHSLFARSILNYLRNEGGDIFSASDMAQSIRKHVSGQSVRMGHLPMSAHAGGEFVFLKIDKDLPPPAKLGDRDDEPVLEVAQLKQQTTVRGRAQSHHAALQMFEQGATNMAIRVLASFGDDRYAQALTEELLQKSKQARFDRVHKLIEDIEKRKADADKDSAAWKDYARPRIVALLDLNVSAASEGDPTTQKLLKIYLTTELGLSGKLQVVEREALDEVLAEMNIGASALADERASVTIGKLLPASLVVMGDLIMQDDATRIMMRAVDTETTRIINSFKGVADAEHDLADVCEDLGEKITAMAIRTRPLSARVLAKDGEVLRAGAGRFQGATPETMFVLKQRSYPDAAKPDDYREKKIGSASVIDLGQNTCDLKPTLDVGGDMPDISSLWIEEQL